jgi:putative ABC transport system permease protein
VALSLAIELVNRSALSEFGNALSIVNGEAHASLVARSNGMAESLYDDRARRPPDHRRQPGRRGHGAP